MIAADLTALRTWLVTQTGLTTVTVKLGPMPDSPDQCISIMDYPGPETPNWQMDDRAQIRCRGPLPAAGVNSFQGAHILANAVIAAVAPPGDTKRAITLSGSNRRGVLRKVSGPMSLGPDSKGRYEITVNIALEASRA